MTLLYMNGKYYGNISILFIYSSGIYATTVHIYEQKLIKRNIHVNNRVIFPCTRTYEYTVAYTNMGQQGMRKVREGPEAKYFYNYSI